MLVFTHLQPTLRSPWPGACCATIIHLSVCQYRWNEQAGNCFFYTRVKEKRRWHKKESVSARFLSLFLFLLSVFRAISAHIFALPSSSFSSSSLSSSDNNDVGTSTQSTHCRSRTCRTTSWHPAGT